MYAVLRRDNLYIHLQWHADTSEDPLLGGSVIKIFVNDINPVFEEFMERGTVTKEKLRLNTSGTPMNSVFTTLIITPFLWCRVFK